MPKLLSHVGVCVFVSVLFCCVVFAMLFLCWSLLGLSACRLATRQERAQAGEAANVAEDEDVEIVQEDRYERSALSWQTDRNGAHLFVRVTIEARVRWHSRPHHDRIVEICNRTRWRFVGMITSLSWGAVGMIAAAHSCVFAEGRHRLNCGYQVCRILRTAFPQRACLHLWPPCGRGVGHGGCFAT